MNRTDNELSRIENLRKRFGFIIDGLRLRQVVTWFLTQCPVRFRAGASSVKIRCWSDLLAFAEIFRIGIYDQVFDRSVVSTYCDLGCQSGFALLRLVQRSGSPTKALLVDGNPRAVERCKANVLDAGLVGVTVTHGAVGCDVNAGRGNVRFALRPNELECAVTVGEHGEAGVKVIDIPSIDVEHEWIKSVGDVPCSLLKIDIEGAERNFLQHNKTFLSRVERCVLEWHDPPVTRNAVIEMLFEQGFVDVVPLCEGDKSGVLCCRKGR